MLFGHDDRADYQRRSRGIAIHYLHTRGAGSAQGLTRGVKHQRGL